jgi:NAD(P)-dependent dehydrogenase (short-subunit alcohol dehydrogenase family)
VPALPTDSETKDRKACVFGASGGIGAALCEALSEQGWTVHACSRSGAGPSGEHITAHRFDLGDEMSIAAIAQVVGPVDLVIVATGVLHTGDYGPEKTYKALDAATMADVFAVNTIGPALIAKHFLPLLPRDRRAIFAALSARVGSISDNRLGGWHSYRASKAALNMLVRNFAIEVGRNNREAVVVALHPGTVDTSLSDPFQSGVPDDKLFTPAFSAAKLLDVLSSLEPQDSGGHFDWAGKPVPA